MNMGRNRRHRAPLPPLHFARDIPLIWGDPSQTLSHTISRGRGTAGNFPVYVSRFHRLQLAETTLTLATISEGPQSLYEISLKTRKGAIWIFVRRGVIEMSGIVYILRGLVADPKTQPGGALGGSEIESVGFRHSDDTRDTHLVSATSPRWNVYPGRRNWENRRTRLSSYQLSNLSMDR